MVGMATDKHPIGDHADCTVVCGICGRPAGAARSAEFGGLCDDCAWWSDGNVSNRETLAGLQAEPGMAKQTAARLAELAEHDGHVSCTPEGCVIR
jgi:hypothetical protein